MTSKQAPGGTARSLIPKGKIGFRGAGMSLSERSRILDELFYEGSRLVPYLWRFYTLIIMSSAIAAFGLINNSTAVVIGAMLMAPLMTPIMAFAAALVQAWGRRQLASLGIVASGSALAIGVAWLITALLPRIDQDAVIPSEILARTSPNLVDLGIAVVAGAAGAYVTVRSEAGSALPGVGIAVALVPPLATVGILLGANGTELAMGALLLFLTNFAAISLAAGLTFAFAGFLPPPERIRRSRWGVAAAVLVVLMLTVPLLANTVSRIDQSSYSADAVRVVASWNPDLEVESVQVDATRSPAEFEITVAGQSAPGPADELATLLAEEINASVDLELLFLPKDSAQASP
ncbi:MAG: DUF389 domain-containing protein [Acidimicrobiia bacterium]